MNKKEFDLWLEKLFSYNYLTEHIPVVEAHQFLLDNIAEYSDETVLNILRCLLHSYYRPMDEDNAMLYKDTQYFRWCKERGMHLDKTEYYYRLINEYEAWEGLTWIVQLIRTSPMEAIKALNLYMAAECAMMPDYRLIGIGQCIDIIEAKFIKNGTNKEVILLNLRPREFEILIYKLYCSMGYDCILTPATRDGGKDVVAGKNNADGGEKLYIECKRYKTTALKQKQLMPFLVW
ncbi:restriction endonuclease [Anaerosporobacter sp.]